MLVLEKEPEEPSQKHKKTNIPTTSDKISDIATER